MGELRRLVTARGLAQVRADALLARVRLLRERTACFTIDSLVNMLAQAGAAVVVSVGNLTA